MCFKQYSSKVPKFPPNKGVNDFTKFICPLQILFKVGTMLCNGPFGRYCLSWQREHFKKHFPKSE